MGKTVSHAFQSFIQTDGDYGWKKLISPTWANYDDTQQYKKEEERKIDDANKAQQAAADAAAAQSRASVIAGAQGEYDKRFKALSDARNADLAGLQERLKQWGFDETSSAWSTGTNTIFSSYEEKLKTLGSDPYFNSVRKQAGWE